MKTLNKMIYALLGIVLLNTTVWANYELTLDECRKLAVENNKKVKTAELNVDASEAVKKSAFTKYFPTISANATTLQLSDYLLKGKLPAMNLPVYDGNPINLRTPKEFAYFPGMELELLDYTNIGSVMATLPIYAGGRIRNGNKMAKIGFEISKEKLKLTKDEVELEVENLYFTIVSLYEKEKTLTAYKNLLDTLGKQVKVAYDAGLRGREDLLKVQLKQNEVESNSIKLRNGIDLATMSLCQKIGIEYNDKIILKNGVDEVKLPSYYKTDTESAIANRTEISMLEKVTEVRQLEKKISMGEAMPSIAVGGAVVYMDFMDKDNTNFAGFATLSVPITEWWSESYKSKEHDTKIAIAENQLEETKELLNLQITKYYRDMEEAYSQIGVAHKTVLQAEEHLKVTRDNYNAGVESVSDVLEAQAIYQEALDAETSAKSQYAINIQNYLQACAK